MIKYVTHNDQHWQSVAIQGATMEACPLWEGKYNVRSKFYRMTKGTQIPTHDHAFWAQLLVMSGKMQVEAMGTQQTLEAGDYYFVEPGELHMETALEDTLLFVVSEETNRERSKR